MRSSPDDHRFGSDFRSKSIFEGRKFTPHSSATGLMGRREAIICLAHRLPANGVKHLSNASFSFIFTPVSDALTTSELVEEISSNGRVEKGRTKCGLCTQLFSVRCVITFRALFLLNCQFLHEQIKTYVLLRGGSRELRSVQLEVKLS